MQDCSISSALAIEIQQSCTKPSIYGIRCRCWAVGYNVLFTSSLTYNDNLLYIITNMTTHLTRVCMGCVLWVWSTVTSRYDIGVILCIYWAMSYTAILKPSHNGTTVYHYNGCGDTLDKWLAPEALGSDGHIIITSGGDKTLISNVSGLLTVIY